MKTQNELCSNIFHHLFLILIAALSVAVSPPLKAQPSDVPPPPPGMVEYYSALLRSGGFHAEDSGPPNPGGGLSGDGGSSYVLPDPGTNLWLLITLASNQETVTVSLSNTVSNVNYLLLVTTNLATGPWVTNQSLLATSTVTVAAPYWTYDYQGVFFKAVEGTAPTPGTVKWSVLLSTSGNDAFGSGLDASPAISSATGRILMTIANNVTPSNSMIFAVDPVFGELQWMTNIFQLSLTNTVTFQTTEMTGSAAIASNGMIYVGGADGNLYSLFPDGSTNWMRAAGHVDSVNSTPAIGSNGLIYVASDEAEEGHAGSVISGVTAFNTNGTTNWFRAARPFLWEWRGCRWQSGGGCGWYGVFSG